MAKGKVIHSGDACTVLVEGNKHVRAEPSTHVIQFPGGHIEVSRTDNDEYWAHIWVNKGQVLDDIHMFSKPGRIVEGRVDCPRPFGDGAAILHGIEKAEHISVRISTNEEDDNFSMRPQGDV